MCFHMCFCGSAFFKHTPFHCWLGLVLASDNGDETQYPLERERERGRYRYRERDGDREREIERKRERERESKHERSMKMTAVHCQL